MSAPGHVVSRIPRNRRPVLDQLAGGSPRFQVHALVELDVSEAAARIAQAEPRVSWTGFLIATLGRAVAQHPEVNSRKTGNPSSPSIEPTSVRPSNGIGRDGPSWTSPPFATLIGCPRPRCPPPARDEIRSRRVAYATRDDAPGAATARSAAPDSHPARRHPAEHRGELRPRCGHDFSRNVRARLGLGYPVAPLTVILAVGGSSTGPSYATVRSSCTPCSR